jgi:hypothetical protein
MKMLCFGRDTSVSNNTFLLRDIDLTSRLFLPVWCEIWILLRVYCILA